MNFWTAIRTCFAKYAIFRGCATRPEFWWFWLFNFLCQFLLGQVDKSMAPPEAMHGAGLLSFLFSLITLLPMLAVSARRLHDVGRSGWWQLLVLIPLFGWLVLLYWLVQPSRESAAYPA